MTEDFRIDINDELYVESFNTTGHGWSFIIKVFSYGEDPFQVFSMNVSMSVNTPKFFTKIGFLEIFANILRAGGWEQLRSSILRFGEVPKTHQWRDIYYSNHAEFSEMEKAFIQITRSLNEFSSGYDFPTKTVSKLIHSHSERFKNAPPETVEDALKFASPSAMRYGDASYDLMKLFSPSRKTNLLKTAKSRTFYHKLYCMALAGKELDGQLFGEWEPPAAKELASKSGAFSFIEEFTAQEVFVQYLNELTFSEIKRIGTSPIFINRNKNTLPAELVEICKLIITGDKPIVVNEELLAVETFATLVQVFEANVGSGSAGKVPSDKERRNFIRGGPHIYVELLEIFIKNKEKISTVQSIKDYCESERFVISTYRDLWDFVGLMFGARRGLWIKNSTQSDSAMKLMCDQLGGAGAVDLAIRAKGEGSPLTFNQWEKFLKTYASVGEDVPFSWVLSMM